MLASLSLSASANAFACFSTDRAQLFFLSSVLLVASLRTVKRFIARAISPAYRSRSASLRGWMPVFSNAAASLAEGVGLGGNARRRDTLSEERFSGERPVFGRGCRPWQPGPLVFCSDIAGTQHGRQDVGGDQLQARDIDGRELPGLDHRVAIALADPERLAELGYPQSGASIEGRDFPRAFGRHFALLEERDAFEALAAGGPRSRRALGSDIEFTNVGFHRDEVFLFAPVGLEGPERGGVIEFVHVVVSLLYVVEGCYAHMTG